MLCDEKRALITAYSVASTTAAKSASIAGFCSLTTVTVCVRGAESWGIRYHAPVLVRLVFVQPSNPSPLLLLCSAIPPYHTIPSLVFVVSSKRESCQKAHSTHQPPVRLAGAAAGMTNEQ